MKLRALIFDDEDIVRTLLSTICMQRGYEVRSFSTPDACPLYSTDECYCTDNQACADIILTDVRMPHVSGLEFIEKLLNGGCRVRNIAFISGSWTDEEYQKALAMGCKTFNKPFDIRELKEWFNECEKGVTADRVLAEWK